MADYIEVLFNKLNLVHSGPSQTLNSTLLNVLIVVILRYFNKSMYILVLIKGCLYP
jgi:hypothetical protein